MGKDRKRRSLSDPAAHNQKKFQKQKVFSLYEHIVT